MYPYKHLKLVFDTDYRRIYPTSGQNYTDVKDPDWERYKATGAPVDLIEKHASCFRVRPIYKDVMAQIEKCDVAGKLPSGRVWERTLYVCKKYFSFLQSEPSHNYGDHSYDLGTSPGLPWSKMGFRSKRQVLDLKPELLMKYILDLDYPEIDSYNDKDELLDINDLLRRKIRGILGSSFQGIYREKYAYGGQNNKLLLAWKKSWIKYGMVKQYGGFSQFVKSLEKHTCVVESDVSGWDRKCKLDPVYEIRNTHIIDPLGEYADLITEVTKSNIRPEMLLPTGYIVQRQTGNNSGKNNTTSDNSLLHFIVVVYLFFKRLDEMGMEMKLSTVFEHVTMGIYSDDKLGAFDLEFFFEDKEEYLSFERDVYAEFGLEIKPTAQLITVKKVGERVDPQHSFLGSYCSFDENSHMYVPFPRMNKICSTFTQKYGNKDVLTRFCRITNLTLNCYPQSDLFKQAMGYLKWYYAINREFQWQFDEILDDVDIDMSMDDSFRRIYMGFESFKPDPVYSPLFA